MNRISLPVLQACRALDSSLPGAGEAAKIGDRQLQNTHAFRRLQP